MLNLVLKNERGSNCFVMKGKSSNIKQVTQKSLNHDNSNTGQSIQEWTK